MRQYFHAFFHWQYSQFFIGGLFAAGVAMLTYSHFLPAYVFFAVAGVWSLIYWQVSDHVTKKAADLQRHRNKLGKKPNHYKTIIAYRNTHRSYWLSNLVGSFALLTLTTGCLIWTHFAEAEYELRLPYGLLVPANDPSPQGFCPDMPDGALQLYFGNNLIWTNKFPHTVIKHQGQDKLVIDRTNKGQLAISVEVRGKDNKIIAAIVRNEFNLTNKALPTHKSRPDRSTLVVYDEEGYEVLNVRYLNRYGLRISGILYFGGRRIDLPMRGFYHVCIGGSGVDFDYD